MIDIAKVKVGDKVHYIPDGSTQYENGVVKEIPDNQFTSVRVVYHCNGEWDNYMDYTSALTPTKHLFTGWKH